MNTLELDDQPQGTRLIVAEMFGHGGQDGIVRVTLGGDLLGIFVATRALAEGEAPRIVATRRNARPKAARAKAAANGATQAVLLPGTQS